MDLCWWSTISPRQYVPRQFDGLPDILSKRKHQIDNDTNLGPAEDPPALKLVSTI